MTGSAGPEIASTSLTGNHAKPVATDPKTTSRAEAFELWMDAPDPMVTFFKTLDVTPLVRLSRRRGLKFNMLLCFCSAVPPAGSKSFTCSPWGANWCGIAPSQ